MQVRKYKTYFFKQKKDKISDHCNGLWRHQFIYRHFCIWMDMLMNRQFLPWSLFGKDLRKIKWEEGNREGETFPLSPIYAVIILFFKTIAACTILKINWKLKIAKIAENKNILSVHESFI